MDNISNSLTLWTLPLLDKPFLPLSYPHRCFDIVNFFIYKHTLLWHIVGSINMQGKHITFLYRISLWHIQSKNMWRRCICKSQLNSSSSCDKLTSCEFLQLIWSFKVIHVENYNEWLNHIKLDMLIRGCL